MKKESRVFKNILYAFAAQGISLVLSLLSSIILPMFLDQEVNYGYWSLFIFYTGYVGFFHFGLNDGVYLKCGGTEYEDMDKSLLGSQFRFGALYQTVIGFGIALFALLFCDDANKSFALIMTAVYMLMYNLTLYLGCIFQAANETRLYSMSVMIDKVVFMVCLVLLFVTKNGDFRVYVWLYILAKLAAFVYCVYKGRDVVFSKNVSLRTTFGESFDSIKIGINLMIANIASNLILGGGRFIIERHWGIQAFGVFSFSLTITNFFLLFISQISMVLFPALRQIDESRQKNVYDMSMKVLLCILPAVFIVYAPAKLFLGYILPKYEVSLKYMALLLPMCIFDGKMNMICATFFKVLRKERFLLAVNLISMTISIVLSAAGAYVFNNINLVVMFMVLSIAIRYVISEIYLEKLICLKEELMKMRVCMAEELVIVALCTAASWYLGSFTAFGACVCLYVVYLVLNKEAVSAVMGLLLRKLKKN